MPSVLFRLKMFHLWSYEQSLLTNRIAEKLMNIKKIKLFKNENVCLFVLCEQSIMNINFIL